MSAATRNGEWHYINHRPAFAVHYYPQKQPEELWYHVFEHELIVYGYKLAGLYDKLKANGWEVLEESQGPYDPNREGPFIQKIEYRMAL